MLSSGINSPTTRINSATDALLIVDMQNDFLLADAPLRIHGGAALIPAINQLSTTFPFRYQVLTQDWHPPHHVSFLESGGPWPPHCIMNTSGAAFHEDLCQSHADMVLQKGTSPSVDSYSAFEDNNKEPTALAERLRSVGVSRVFLCGVAYDYCVYFNAISAKDLGFEVFIVEDASAATSTASQAERQRDLAQRGIHLIQLSVLQ